MSIIKYMLKYYTGSIVRFRERDTPLNLLNLIIIISL